MLLSKGHTYIFYQSNNCIYLFDLIGPRNLKDTLTAAEKGGIVCQTGLLGGVYVLNGFDPIKDIPNGVYLTGFFSNYPTQQIVDDIFAFLNEKKLVPASGRASRPTIFNPLYSRGLWLAVTITPPSRP